MAHSIPEKVPCTGVKSIQIFNQGEKLGKFVSLGDPFSVCVVEVSQEILKGRGGGA